MLLRKAVEEEEGMKMTNRFPLLYMGLALKIIQKQHWVQNAAVGILMSKSSHNSHCELIVHAALAFSGFPCTFQSSAFDF